MAVYSHFGPGKFPDTWWTVLSCVVLYCVINVVLTIFGHIKEGSSFLITHPKPVRGALACVRVCVCRGVVQHQKALQETQSVGVWVWVWVRVRGQVQAHTRLLVCHAM